MKTIATVTLHLPCNYGNALQTLALHKFLKSNGYHADVLSAWFFKDQDEILHTRNLLKKGIIGWLNLFCRFCSFTGYFLWSIREIKLNKWLAKHISWSDVSGPISNFPYEETKYKILVAGSDQIWNPSHFTSDFYLLKEFPESIAKISYAASFGCDTLPKASVNKYKDALSRFAAISVRETSGEEILTKTVGVNARHVADPTLLLSKEEWVSLLNIKPSAEKKEIFFYFVTPDITKTFPLILSLSKQSRLPIHVFYQNIECPIYPPKIKMLLKIWIFRIKTLFSRIKIHLTATPSEFVQRLHSCEYIITDSFHGMMFSTIFEKKATILIGNDAQRQQMSARIYDFTSSYGFQNAISKSISIPTEKLFITPKLQSLINESKSWLTNTINSI